jgi:glycosyltransferase involved in cell wall biosynthesis
VIVYHWTPLPPAPNGIADYAARLNTALHQQLDLVCVNENPFSKVPPGSAVIDPLQAWRDMPEDALPVYQIGNNPDHLGIYRAALDRPGLTVLHDIRLFYLHELMRLAPAQFEAMLIDSNPVMAQVRRAAILRQGKKIASDYICFDMAGDLLRRSRMVLVHSHYARTILLRHHGAAFADRIAVLPHFALDPALPAGAADRTGLEVPEGATLVVTSGFATRAKRFDWMVAALSALVMRGHDIFWVHAGSERPAEFNLSGLIAAHPALAGRVRVTGYVDEARLDAWLAAADIVVNLRFPSVGESSGTLARAMALGRCCVVNRTAAYDEIPDDVVAKCSPVDAVAALERMLEALILMPEARAAFGRNARAYATGQLSLADFARNFADLCRRARDLEPLGAALLDRPVTGDRAVLGSFDPADMTAGTIADRMPPGFVPDQIEFHRSATRNIRVEAVGLDAAAPALAGAP